MNDTLEVLAAHVAPRKVKCLARQLTVENADTVMHLWSRREEAYALADAGDVPALEGETIRAHHDPAVRALFKELIASRGGTVPVLVDGVSVVYLPRHVSTAGHVCGAVSAETAIEYNGQSSTVEEWAARVQLPVELVVRRLNKRGNFVQAVTTPTEVRPHFDVVSAATGERLGEASRALVMANVGREDGISLAFRDETNVWRPVAPWAQERVGLLGHDVINVRLVRREEGGAQ